MVIRRLDDVGERLLKEVQGYFPVLIVEPRCAQTQHRSLTFLAAARLRSLPGADGPCLPAQLVITQA